ncbi:MAG: hypothetical protein R2747_01375 [Pyrinomonadaceae bacterium]
MKFFYKTLLLGVFLTALAVVSPTFAQDVCADIEANQALYKVYTDNYKGPITEETLPAREKAVAAAKEYVEKYANCADFEAQVNYLKTAGPSLAAKIEAGKIEIAKQKRYIRFNQAAKNGQTAELFEAGKDILKYEPDFLDVIIVLASVGLDEAADKKNNTYNNEALSYAKSAISKIEGGAESKEYGLFGYIYKTKENTLGWMNYTIGYIMYYPQNNKDAALPYFYKATQFNSETKDRYFIYDLIGDFYAAKASKLGEEIIALIEANEGKETDETKQKFALQKGYAERAADAYARAYSLSKTAKPAPKADYVSGLKQRLEAFYKFRFITDPETPQTEIDSQLTSYVASVSSKPFPSPTSEVQPVAPPAEEEKTDSANTSSMATPSKPAPKPAAASGNGTKGKSEADKTANKPNQR